MSKARRFFTTSFGSALMGGLVVAAAGLIAAESGAFDNGGSTAANARSVPLIESAISEAGDPRKGLTVSQIYARDGGGVAYIQAEQRTQTVSPFDPFPQEQSRTATGSGFVIDGDGHLLTNAHVVEGAQKVTVRMGQDGEALKAEVVGSDPSTDVAVLSVDPGSTHLNPLPLGDSTKVGVGDPVVAIGNPFGLDRTVTSGIVSALQREISSPNGFAISDVIQTDAAINPGNSGGPLIDATGDVVGINSQIATQSGGSEGIGFAVPIATAREVADQLLNDGKVERAYLGVSGGDLNPELAHALNIEIDKGAIVSSTIKGGPADQAGIRGGTGQATIGGQSYPIGGDVIVAIDGTDISTFDEVAAAVSSHDPGDEVTVTVYRDGQRKDLTVKLGDRPASIQDSRNG